MQKGKQTDQVEYETSSTFVDKQPCCQYVKEEAKCIRISFVFVFVFCISICIYYFEQHKTVGV